MLMFDEQRTTIRTRLQMRVRFASFLFGQGVQRQ
jgi:hypothetical protein